MVRNSGKSIVPLPAGGIMGEIDQNLLLFRNFRYNRWRKEEREIKSIRFRGLPRLTVGGGGITK